MSVTTLTIDLARAEISSGFSRMAWEKYIRGLKMSSRNVCFVCRAHKYITHAHHVIPVWQMASLLELAGKCPHELPNLEVSYVWLCPNHHVIWHELTRVNGKAGHALYGELCDIERERYEQLQELENQAWAQFYEVVGADTKSRGALINE